MKMMVVIRVEVVVVGGGGRKVTVLTNIDLYCVADAMKSIKKSVMT